MKDRRPADLPLAPVPADPWADHVLSHRYRLGAKIGAGGMADVYEGVDTRLQRPVAVKVFRPGPQPQTEDRLAEEAVLLAQLHGPGLVTLYDIGRRDDRTYLVMELVDGPTLGGLLAGGALPRTRVAALGAALARALAHVHRAGIVHRDVKPSNVLLDADGAPHLADFGIARLVDTTRHTAPDVLTGTAAYLAPEQVAGGRIGPAADVYALGLVLLECLKGTPEYTGTPLEAAIARIHRPPAIPDGLPAGLVALLRAMTAQDPAARPTADECARTLTTLTAAPDPHPARAASPAPGGASAPAASPARAGAPASAGAIMSPEPEPEPVAASLASPALAQAPRAAGPDAEHPVAVTRRARLGGPRHNRRLAVGTVLAALTVALGTTVAVAPGTSGTGTDPTSAAAPEHRSAPGADPGNSHVSTPPTPRVRPASATAPADEATADTADRTARTHRAAPAVERGPAARAATPATGGTTPATPEAHRPPAAQDQPAQPGNGADNSAGKGAGKGTDNDTGKDTGTGKGRG
ncbi:protein kinase [Streptomyces sp. NPDC005012]|uniref:protein kinase domain-containing protein n=1 Tax=Streptomyces sp. NPDC005012 TaxID=3154558 RepID=UPI0033AD1114